MNWMEEVLTAHIHQGSPVPTSQDCCSHKREHPSTHRDEVVVLKAVPGRFEMPCNFVTVFSGSHTDILDRTCSS